MIRLNRDQAPKVNFHQLAYTTISHNARQFVCEGLYYQVLSHLQSTSLKCQVLFIHVPIFTSANYLNIMQDVQQILNHNYDQ